MRDGAKSGRDSNLSYIVLMRRLPLVNLALLLVCRADGLGVLKPPREASAMLALSAPARSATAIRIERSGNPAIAIEKKGEIWRLTAPMSAEADPIQVQRLLAIRTARSPQRFPATGLERFELDRPRIQITIDDEVFVFGMVNAVSSEQYVLAQNAVFAIEPRYGSALQVDAMELARKQLFSSSEAPLIEMYVQPVKRREWLAPSTEPLSQDDLARWVENWRLASALRVAPLAPRPALGEVRIDLKSGGSVKLAILQSTPELVIAREDEGLQYHFPAAIAQRLLQPPAAARDERAQK
jgi:hypothetical protein